MKLATIAGFSLLVGFSAQSFAAPPLEEILARVEQVDHDIRVLKTEGTAREYAWDETTSSWKATPQISSFQCVIENKPKGRYVLTENPAIMRWEKGSAPYLAEWRVEFRDSDGLVTHWVKTEQYHDGTQLINAPIERKEVYRAKTGFYAINAQIVERTFSGLGYTALKVLRHAPVYFPDRAKDTTVSDAPEGMVHVRSGIPEACVVFDYVLDPRKNFALVRYTYSQDRATTTTDDELVWTFEVLEDRQIAPGLWYPVHCTDTRTYSKERAEWQRRQEPPNNDPDRADPFAPHKSELILTKIALLDDKAAEPDLTVKLPDDLDIHTEE